MVPTQRTLRLPWGRLVDHTRADDRVSVMQLTWVTLGNGEGTRQLRQGDDPLWHLT